MNSSPLVIIGGGPAGIAAAIEASRAGLRCTLIDEAPRLGGQIYRQPPQPFAIKNARELGKDLARGEKLRAEFAAMGDRVEVLNGSAVVGISGRQIAWTNGDAFGTMEADRIIIATGAYDRPVPFPGWTLPGIMTAGGAQGGASIRISRDSCELAPNASARRRASRWRRASSASCRRNRSRSCSHLTSPH